MRYVALAVDYDGTLASRGMVQTSTVAALESLKRSGRLLLLVTGRRLGDLQGIFPALELFDCVVAENGALVWSGRAREEMRLGKPPPRVFLDALERRGVAPLDIGRVIVATTAAHAETVLETIRDYGIEHQMIFSKGALMVLPAGVDKTAGLRVALRHLNVTATSTVGVGDAENDETFLRACGYSVAVANALPALKAAAHRVTAASNGGGVVEVIEELLRSDGTLGVAGTK